MSKHRIRPAELAQLERLSPADLKRPRKLRSQRITDHQDMVFSLPELREIIADYLTKTSTCALATTCRKWRTVWLPVMLNRFPLLLDIQSIKLPSLVVIGQYVLNAEVHITAVHDELISALSASVRQIKVRMLYSAPWWPRLALTRLRNLQVLEWKKGTVVVEDIVASLQAASQLQHLSFSYMFIEDGPDVPVAEQDGNLALNTTDPYADTQLRRLQFEGCEISDKALLRLLSIDMTPTPLVSTRPSHALTYLHVQLTGYRHATYKSTARILKECYQLRHLDLEDTGAVSPELFFEDGSWPCAAILEHLAIQIMPAEQRRPAYGAIGAQPLGSSGDLTIQQQQMIFQRLKSFTSLRRLDLTGYPMGLLVLEDMSFARNLEQSRIQVRTTNRHTIEELDRVAELGNQWLRRQPAGWECKMHDSWNVVYLVSYDKTRTEKSERVERLGW
ncbi:hypothetical protein MVEG_09462 [Podila verticillata NRRL 6337]|nr:hypothetical protein MVEG_09462 [Podila verticillata NRRL 6337]